MSKTKPYEILYEEIKDFTGMKPVGGERLQQKLRQGVEGDSFRLFVPWAAYSGGRIEPTLSDRMTLDWLFEPGGLVERIGKFGKTTCLMMFADTYVSRNGFDMDMVTEYWANISASVSENADITFTTTSLLEDAQMERLRAKNAYAFEKLEPGQRRKILQAASRYSGATGEREIYESAAEYNMLRAAEAEYVDQELDAIWVSLNWQERDLMCGNAPRIYIPEQLRAPWLKET